LTETRTAFSRLDASTRSVCRSAAGASTPSCPTDETEFERFRQIDGVADASVEALPLEEIFVAVAGDEKGGAS
jgi:hypothetical protein